jgi:putative FmdB family regulatory protein
MPTYEYRCPNGHQFERFQRITEASRRARCPACSRLASRVISGGAGLVFKGSGFYITDYGRDGKGARKGGKPEKAEKGEDSGAAKPERNSSAGSEGSKKAGE